MWSLIGNQRAVEAVSRSVDGEATPHAFLLAGPRHTGKATLAIQLAQALNCDSGDPPCGECTPCRRIASAVHSDVQPVGVEESSEGPQRRAISVEQVRDVERAVALSPFEGRTRVVTFDPADEMTTGAQNAFLKTLEEPPPHVVFILIAEREDRLLETIRSRCRRIALGIASVPEIEEALLDRGIEPERARLLARLSGGRPGLALRLTEDETALEKRREWLESARSLPSLTVAERMDLAQKLTEDYRRDRERVLRLLAEWAAWYRDLLLVRAGAEEAASAVDMLEELRQDSERHNEAELADFVQALTEARAYLEANVQARLALEALLLRAPGVSASPAGR